MLPLDIQYTAMLEYKQRLSSFLESFLFTNKKVRIKSLTTRD